MSIVDELTSVKDKRQRCHACKEVVFDCPGHMQLRAHLFEQGVIRADDSRIEKPVGERAKPSRGR